MNACISAKNRDVYRKEAGTGEMNTGTGENNTDSSEMHTSTREKMLHSRLRQGVRSNIVDLVPPAL